MALDFYAYGMAGLLLGGDCRSGQDRKRLTDQLSRLLSGEMVHPQRD